MTLGERIKECRQQAGMSQEKAAELVGVSRQAVTKWESGQTAPSTENLFRLAEVLNVPVERLLEQEGETVEGESVVEQVYTLFRAEEDRRAQAEQARLRRRRADRLTALGVAAGFAAVYLLGRFLFVTWGSETSLSAWLFEASPYVYTYNAQWAYPFSWLVGNGLYWWSMLISALPAVWGRRRFSLAASAGALVGLLGGTLFGRVPEPMIPDHNHYGWLIWGVCFLLGIAAGIVWEWWSVRRRKRKEA